MAQRTAESALRCSGAPMLCRESPISRDFGSSTGAPGLRSTWVLLVLLLLLLADFSVSFLAYSTHYANPSAPDAWPRPQSHSEVERSYQLWGTLWPEDWDGKGTRRGRRSVNCACVGCKSLRVSGNHRALAEKQASGTVPLVTNWTYAKFHDEATQTHQFIFLCPPVPPGRFQASKIHR